MKITGTKALFGVAVLSALWAAAPASAIPITDTVNPTDTTITVGITPSPCPSGSGFTCTLSALSFVHDITDNGFSLLDTIVSATVAITLSDSGSSEDYTFTFGSGAHIFADKNISGDETTIITLNAAALADLQADGKISVKVGSTDGDFLFADSLLTAQVTKFVSNGPLPTNRVPEPSTLLLLGAGLAAFGWRIRRRS